jgi:hypothetical protein
VAARGATTTGAGIALKAASRINQQAAPACPTFHREPRQVAFRTFFLSPVGVTNTGGRQISGSGADGRQNSSAKVPQRLRIADGSIIRKLSVILQIGVRSLHRQSVLPNGFQAVAPKKQRTALEPNLSQEL